MRAKTFTFFSHWLQAQEEKNTTVTSENFCKNLIMNSHSYGNIYECPFKKGVSLPVARFSVLLIPRFWTKYGSPNVCCSPVRGNTSCHIMHIMAPVLFQLDPKRTLPLNSTRGMMWYHVKREQFTQLQKSLVLLTVLISKVASGPIKNPFQDPSKILISRVTALGSQALGHTVPRSPWTDKLDQNSTEHYSLVISFQLRYYTKSETLCAEAFYSIHNINWQSSLVLNSSLKVNKPQDACCLKQ